MLPSIVFELSVQARFSAAHAITIAGTREPLHGHDWLVTATVSSSRLDREGLVCDFHMIEAALRDITGPFNNHNLNEIPPFSEGLNPTAEHVAQHIARELGRMLRLPEGVMLTSVNITEAPGCTATYRP